VQPRAGRVQCRVFDGSGRLVAKLTDGSHPAGEQRLTWNAAGVPPGVYHLRLSGAAAGSARVVRAE